MGTLADDFRRVVREARERRGVALMGICNVTPDSFSDGGRHFSADAACARVDQLLAEGADILDVGGESTRPGAEPVPPAEQIRRIEAVVRHASRKACVSVDTTSPEVAEAALAMGASVVNDVSCLADVRLAEVVARAGAGFVIMHARGPAAARTTYVDVVTDVIADWKLARKRALSAGVPASALVMDPGLGFSKTAEESASVLARLDEIVRSVDAPVLVGASRKSFLKLWSGAAAAEDRTGASIGSALVAMHHGAAIVRIHDVRDTRQAVDCVRALHASKVHARREEALHA